MGDLALIVDPEAVERRYIAMVLAGEGLDIIQVESPIEGIIGAMEKSEDAAVIILAEETDPVHIDDVIRVIRHVTSVPLLVVGSEGSSELDSLYYGADDYMARPFSASGLIARVHVMTRRRGGNDPGVSGRTPAFVGRPSVHSRAIAPHAQNGCVAA